MTKLLITALLIIPFISGCCSINTSSPMNSVSIANSKKKKVFIQNYVVSTDIDSFVISEAWLEYGHYNSRNARFELEIQDWYQLVFTIDEGLSKKCHHVGELMTDWNLKEQLTDFGISISIQKNLFGLKGQYCFNDFNDTKSSIPGEIIFKLYKKDNDTNVFLGDVVFKAGAD